MSITSASTASFAGSSILRQSPPFGSPSNTGPGGDDLSLSELYISDHSDHLPRPEPFSLLPRRDENNEYPQPNQGEDHFTDVNYRDRGVDENDPTMTETKQRSVNTQTREERLLHDLFVLKKLNSSFTAYNNALDDTMKSTESVAVQLDRTDRLLNQYVNLLQHTEKNSKLIFDQLWEGGGTDQEILETMRLESIQQAKREQEERNRAAQLEIKKLEQEEEDRKARESKEMRERERYGTTRGARGVRGSRARGLARGASTSVRGRVLPNSATQIKKGASVAATRGARRS